MCFGGLPHSLIMSLSVQIGFSLGMRLYGRRFGYLQRVVFTKNFWMSVEKFLFCFWSSEVMFDWSKGSKFEGFKELVFKAFILLA
jgi:hypothetical protein